MAHKNQKNIDNEDTLVRIDKWLWAARFYKTRGLASDAIKGGKIRLNGSRPKPSKAITLGAKVSISQGGLERVFIVQNISDKRGSAPIAQTLYNETVESQLAREEYSAQMKASANFIQTEGRPNKKNRRLIHRFKQKNQE